MRINDEGASHATYSGLQRQQCKMFEVVKSFDVFQQRHLQVRMASTLLANWIPLVASTCSSDHFS